MRSTRLMAAATLVLVAVAASVPHIRADQRSDLMNVGGTPPSALGQASIDIMHGLPRYGSGEHTLGVIDPGNSDTYETNKNYAVGIILPFGILIGLGLLTWSSCFGFCAARACCDSCGKRAATRSYTSRDQVCLKVWIILSAMVFVVLFGIGIVSNAAVSSSLDESYKRSDAVVELLYEFNGPVKKMSISAADALAQVEYLNTTVYSALPSPAQAAGYIDCTNLMYSTVTAEQQLLVAIAPITGSSSPSGSNRALNFTLLSLEMRAIRPAATALQKQLPPEIPNLVGVNTTLQAVGPQPLYTDGVLPSQRVSTAQNLFLNGSSTGALFSSQLDPTLNLLQPTVQPLRNVLGRYEQSAQTCGATTQQAVYNEVNSGSVTAQTRSDIAALNQSIALLPSLSEFNAAMNNFQTYFTALTAIASTLTTSLDSYRSAIADLSLPPAFTSVLTSMQTSVPTYQAAQSSANANTTRLQSSLRQTGISTSAFSAQVTQLSLDLQSAQTAVQSLKEAGSTSNTTAGGAPSLGDTMKMVNYTLPQLNCIRPIFSQLLSLNKTILILPDQVTQLLERRNQLLVQLQRITRVQYDLTASYYALSSFNSSLSGFPNLTTTIQATNALATAVAQFPDCQQASVQLGQIQTAMDTMTGGYLSSLQSGYSSFTTAATNAQSDVNSVAAALDDLSAAIQQVAPQLQAHTTYASNLATVVTALQPDLTAVYQQSIQPAFTPIVDPLRTRFLGELQAYATVFATAPDRARLDASLSALSANITSTLSSDGSISSTLNNLQTAAQAYTDSTPVFTALNGIYLSQTQAPLAPLFTTLPHLALNASLSRFPDVSSQATLVSQSQSGLQSQSSVFKLLEADLQTSRGFLTRDDVDTMQNNINAMVNIVTNFPDLNSSLSSLSLAAHGLSTATNSLSSYHHEYYVARQTTVVFKNHIDWLRLLGYLLVLLVPTCVSVCGFTAWLGKRPMGSIYMGMCSFTMAAIFFIMTGIQIIPSVLIADQCVDLNTFLTDNFNQFGLSPTALEPWIQMNDSTKAGAIFQYFVDCDQPRPPLFDVFGRPAEVLQQNHINFTDYRAKVVGSLTSSNQTIVLRPNVYSAFDALDVDVQGVELASLETYGLIDCQKSSSVWEPFRTSICSSSGVAGAISLSTCICFLFAICLLPGVCVGMVGYKRFDPKNFGVAVPPEEDKAKQQNIYTAGLAERPKPIQTGSPMSSRPQQQQQFHSPGPMSPSLASPVQTRPFSPSVAYSPHPAAASIDHGVNMSMRNQQATMSSHPQPAAIAMPGISSEEIEMHAMKAQGHRASLQMALASNPHAQAPTSSGTLNFAAAPEDVVLEEEEEHQNGAEGNGHGGAVTYQYD